MCEGPLSRALSFDGWNAQWLQILHEGIAGDMRGGCLLAFFGAERHRRVELVEVSLEAFFGFFGQARELDPHPDTGIAGANHGGGRQALLFDPQVHPERSTDGQRHDSLYITAIPTDVCSIHAQRCIYALVAKFQRIGNLVPHEFSAVVVALLGPFVHFTVPWKNRRPRTILV